MILRKKGYEKRFGDSIFRLSIALNAILFSIVLFYLARGGLQSASTHGFETTWHGGHPEDSHAGSCWCGNTDKYCMCTPNLAIDLIISSGKDHEYVWLVRRKDTNQLATMGGFVYLNESAEDAVKREIKEEMDIDLVDPPILFGVYSDPRRDNRRRTVSVAYAVHLKEDIHPRAGDDVKEVSRITLDEIEKHNYFSDHKTILLDFRRFVRHQPAQEATDGDFALDIRRSTCAKHFEVISNA